MKNLNMRQTGLHVNNTSERNKYFVFSRLVILSEVHILNVFMSSFQY